MRDLRLLFALLLPSCAGAQPPAQPKPESAPVVARKERLAIVIRGLVQSAPVIQGELTGGHALVTTGGATVEAMRASAEQLVSVLRNQAK